MGGSRLAANLGTRQVGQYTQQGTSLFSFPLKELRQEIKHIYTSVCTIFQTVYCKLMAKASHAIAGKGIVLKCVDGQRFPWWWPCPILCPYPNAQRMMKVTVKISSRLTSKQHLSSLGYSRILGPLTEIPWNAPWQMPGKSTGSLSAQEWEMPAARQP